MRLELELRPGDVIEWGLRLVPVGDDWLGDWGNLQAEPMAAEVISVDGCNVVVRQDGKLYCIPRHEAMEGRDAWLRRMSRDDGCRHDADAENVIRTLVARVRELEAQVEQLEDRIVEDGEHL